jgi:hypothetical protein
MFLLVAVLDNAGWREGAMKHLAVPAKCRAPCVRESNSVSESRFFEEMKVRPITVDSTTFVPGKVWGVSNWIINR